MLQLENHTPFTATMAVLPNQDAVDTLYIVVKATVILHPRLALAPKQLPVTLADEYHGDPTNTSLKAVSDLHIGKPGTDVLVTGHAKAPNGRPTPQMLVTLAVAERQKTLRVYGDRVWRKDGTPTEPQPFTAMPLTWERAYGGVHLQGERLLSAEERNPVGCGFLGERDPAELEGHPAPNLLDVNTSELRLTQPTLPACFAPTSPSWLPRRQYAGTYDAAWQRKRAPYLPQDFNPSFLQCAADELRFDRFLQGTEPVRLTGMTLERPIEFTVPTVRPQIEVIIARNPTRAQAELETLWIEPDENQASLTWRANLPVDRKALKVEKVRITLPQQNGSRS
jgi:hypothetical protein